MTTSNNQQQTQAGPIAQQPVKKPSNWKGFSDKKLWDWLGLLIIPVILAVGGFLFTEQQNHTSGLTHFM
ncbi:MAG TPA: hypothetical protein DCL75_12965 [Ktedonobacter sp.]|jgi:hypothetical protein|nr:hypothetical protein [Ktedonobacter sp.]HCF88088.1 hypothetical protein [Ktedonobacter sp.]